jgi:uncharacterized alpha-E superfamily protein
MAIRLASTAMLSRMADSLYWIGRYVERAEDTARITHVNYQHTLGMGSSPEAESRRRRQWEALVTIVGDASRFRLEHAAADEDTVPPYLTFDRSNPNSIITCIASAREQARTMRHQIASEMWEALNRFHLDLQRRVEQSHGIIDAEDAYPFYRSIVDFSHLFQGITDSTMPREEGWYFLQAGKFLERAEKTARALDVKYHLLVADADPTAPVAGPGFARAAADLTPEDGVIGEWHQWLAVLRSLSAYEAYHKIYRSGVRPRSVVEMLLLSPAFPRSIRFAIEEVDTALARIAVDCAPLLDAESLGGSSVTTGGPTEAERAVGRLRSQLAYQRVEEVFDAGLHDYLLDLQRRCYEIGERIHAQYFAHRVLRAEEVLAS